MRLRFPKITFWRVVAAIILAAGAAGTVIRFTRGLGASTHLSDRFPWGLWIGFDILCGVGLAAGGFTLAAIVHIFHVKRFEPIVRPTILTAFLGYLLVIVGLMFDLGRPLQIWHAMVMWNPRSVMFEVAWCVMLYTTVLALEFAPVVLERFRLSGPLKVLKAFGIPIIITGVLLSTLHQSSLGTLYLIMPEKLYALWYSPYLPVFFFTSAVAVGCAMVILESTLSARAFGRGLELPLLGDVARICVVMLGVYATMKALDLIYAREWTLLLAPRRETWFWWAEIAIGVIAPLVLLSRRSIRRRPGGLFIGAVLVILGFVLNRLNVSITGLEAAAGVRYFPHWIELAVTLSIVTGGFIAFALAVKHLPVFTPHQADAESAAEERERWVEQLRAASRTA